MANELVGNGMLAKAFENSVSDNCLFFCSGVSNSNEVSESHFEREELLLKKYIDTNVDRCFVYFSSILAPLEQNNYFQHKMKMEKIVSKHSSEYFIIRLPQVAGAVLNTTLLSTFVQNIYEDKKIIIHKNAERTIIDVDDVVKVFDIIRNQNINESNKVLNFCTSYSFKPQELIYLISKYIGKEASFDLVDKGSVQKCNYNENEEGIIISKFFSDKTNYLEIVVEKYVSKIVKLIESQAYGY